MRCIIPERKFHFHFSVSQTAPPCNRYFQLWQPVPSSLLPVVFCVNGKTDHLSFSIAVIVSFRRASDSRKKTEKTNRLEEKFHRRGKSRITSKKKKKSIFRNDTMKNMNREREREFKRGGKYMVDWMEKKKRKK